MSYDGEFDQSRLDQLAAQYLTTSIEEGNVFFQSYSEDNRLDLARWRIEGAGHDVLKASGFKYHLHELLDILFIYRAQHNQLNASQCVVKICNRRLAIEWLQKNEFEVLWE